MQDEVSIDIENLKDNDLISRQAVIETMYELCDTGETLKENPWRDNPHIDAITDAIEDLPPVTQKSGHWIPIPYELDYETDAECSLCHEKFIDAINYDYCPKCGYRMQKSGDEG